ncbi:hypothetical protein MA16_Dca017680 [Dendrobium catenatum]|uniref:Uncharacterized protein n=1 Tax=Dendrobium catenatum TaxID=906689 RepID=A0A2I0XAB2_9ASPA|nr:hypothetical protein MA16_Dca017680 [Dendrobium catenatum]
MCRNRGLSRHRRTMLDRDDGRHRSQAHRESWAGLVWWHGAWLEPPVGCEMKNYNRFVRDRARHLEQNRESRVGALSERAAMEEW